MNQILVRYQNPFETHGGHRRRQRLRVRRLDAVHVREFSRRAAGAGPLTHGSRPAPRCRSHTGCARLKFAWTNTGARSVRTGTSATSFRSVRPLLRSRSYRTSGTAADPAHAGELGARLVSWFEQSLAVQRKQGSILANQAMSNSSRCRVERLNRSAQSTKYPARVRTSPRPLTSTFSSCQPAPGAPCG